MRIFGTCIAILALTAPAFAGPLSGRWETDAANCLREALAGQYLEINETEDELFFGDHSTEGGNCLIERTSPTTFAAACRFEENGYEQTTIRMVPGDGLTVIVSSEWFGRGFTTYHACPLDIGYGE